MDTSKEPEEQKEDLSPDRDGTIIKSIIVSGEKFNCPSDHSPVKVHAVGSDLNGRVFYDRELEYIMGEGFEHQLPKGFDKALRRINKGEKCKVTLKGRFGYGTQPPSEFGLNANETIIFTLFLKDFEKKLIEALKFKERGTKFFGEGKYQLALSKYNAIVSLLEFARPSKPDEEEGKQLTQKYEQTLIAAWLNIVLVNLKMGEKAEAIRNCDKVLEKKPKNVKALYRKAQAQQMFKDFEEAIETYKIVLELEPENKAAIQQIQECRHQLNILNERERKKFKGLFDRLANENQEEGNKMEGI
ncbi:unnamed protein product [Meloidogyne enterolobii]|uniref:Uncharacterized protein n=1 Tax=Meloidogyne enterolobii TaxID=390850 RepID=A0ACB0Y8X0_MELEN